jgi:hypothetical protein
MISRAIVLTVVFTLTAVTISLCRLGPLAVAMLGGFALWLLPGHLAVSLPAAAFGGVLMTHAEGVDSNEDREEARGQTVRLILCTTLVSLLCVGWLMPWAYQESGRAFSRFVDRSSSVEEPARARADLTLEELLVRGGSDPVARSELTRRAGWVGAAFFLPLLAILLCGAHRRWTYQSALGATVAVFAACVVFWNNS